MTAPGQAFNVAYRFLCRKTLRITAGGCYFAVRRKIAAPRWRHPNEAYMLQSLLDMISGTAAKESLNKLNADIREMERSARSEITAAALSVSRPVP